MRITNCRPVVTCDTSVVCYSHCCGADSTLTAVFTGDQPFLMSVRDNIIFGISLDPEVKSNDAMVPISGIQHGYDVEFDDSEQFIYWVENPVRFGCIQCVRSLFKFPQGIPT